jgi:hypothetical protein
MGNLETLKRDILTECEEDHVGLWSVIRDVEDAFPSSNPADVRDRVLRLLHELLVTQEIKAGFPTANGQGFRSLRGSPDKVLERIKEEWPVGRRPTIGEGIWFTKAKRTNQS